MAKSVPPFLFTPMGGRGIVLGRRHYFKYTFSLPFGQFLIYKHFFRDDWPQSAYMNSMDVWQIMSYLNVFFVLVEYCLVLWLSKGVPLNDVSGNKISPISRKKTVRSQYILNIAILNAIFFNFREKSKEEWGWQEKLKILQELSCQCILSFLPLFTLLYVSLAWIRCISPKI